MQVLGVQHDPPYAMKTETSYPNIAAFLAMGALLVLLLPDELSFLFLNVTDWGCICDRSQQEYLATVSICLLILKSLLYAALLGCALSCVFCEYFVNDGTYRGKNSCIKDCTRLCIIPSVLVISMVTNLLHPAGAFTMNGLWRPCDASLLQWRCTGPIGKSPFGTVCDKCPVTANGEHASTMSPGSLAYVYQDLCHNANSLTRCYEKDKEEKTSKLRDKFRRMGQCCRRGGFMILRNTECNDPPELQRIYGGGHMIVLFSRELLVLAPLLVAHVIWHSCMCSESVCGAECGAARGAGHAVANLETIVRGKYHAKAAHWNV